MTFAEFARRMGEVLQGPSDQSALVKTLFEMIIPEDRSDLLKKSHSTWKNYYQGNSIKRYAKTIITAANPTIFEKNIRGLDRMAKQRLCKVFLDVFPDADTSNIGKKLGELFETIIQDSAGLTAQEYLDLGKHSAMSELNRLVTTALHNSDNPDPFRTYVEKAENYYSMKKTLLYLEQKRPFYGMYVCNDLRLKRAHGKGVKALDGGDCKKNVTVSFLEKYSKQNIIEGTGGIGKSMFMTHLFLSSAEEFTFGGKLPILCLLKDYKESYSDLEAFMLKAVNEFAPNAILDELEKKLEMDQVILLLDGLDEIKSGMKESFDDNLVSFVKRFPNCVVVLTSRPISNFVSYAAFNVYDILPLDKKQAVALIKKLEFWDEKAKEDFLVALNRKLFTSHYEFASNPLLLTIMLMTYSNYGDIPAKMHAFYAEAYKTMARAHDATKGSFQRTLYTGLSPERFAVYYSAFCARTLVKEQLEFTTDEFVQQMKKAIGDIPKEDDDEGASLSPSDFLRDLIDNLCIMYTEGDIVYFIHRSFQEYFAAVYFSSDDEILCKAGRFFDDHEGMYCYRMLAMLFDMIPDRVERIIYYPCLERKFSEYKNLSCDEYIGYLLKEYPNIYYNEGVVEDPEHTRVDALLYLTILSTKKIGGHYCFEVNDWKFGDECKVLDRYFYIYSGFDKEETDKEAVIKRSIESEGDDMVIVNEDSVTVEYINMFGYPSEIGCIYDVDVKELIANLPNQQGKYQELLEFLSSEKCPLYIEYKVVRDYYNRLKERVEKRKKSLGLFDD